MPGVPNPYHTEFAELKFGEWRANADDYRPRTQQPRLASAPDLFETVLSMFADEGMSAGIKGCMLLAHDMRLLFGTRKLRYEACIGENTEVRGRIDIPFANICGISLDDLTNTVTFLLTSPPETYLGRRTFAEGTWTKTSPQYDSHQTDFSNGPIKQNRLHTVILGTKQYRGIKKKLTTGADLATALNTGIDHAASSLLFSAEEIAAWANQKDKLKERNALQMKTTMKTLPTSRR